MHLTTGTNEQVRLDLPVKIGTRGSELALWQAHHVRDELRRHWGEGLAVELVLISTEGDRILDRPLNQIGGKGLFVNAIEEQLVSGAVDLAVHSMKDLPGHLAPGLAVVCTPPREDPRDALVLGPRLRERLAKGASIADLPAGTVLGTTSLRRTALARRLNQGLDVRSLRGNVPTRLRKLAAGEYDAILLAAAGLVRLGLAEQIDARLDPESFCPAACQGILALECREEDARIRALVAPLGDADAAVMAACERAFLARLDGGCQVPMGCHAELREGDRLHVRGVVADPAGRPVFTATREGPRAEAALLGRGLAELLLQLGADEVLTALAHSTPTS
jgi:hydroxymethylbilane synthase